MRVTCVCCMYANEFPRYAAVTKIRGFSPPLLRSISCANLVSHLQVFIDRSGTDGCGHSVSQDGRLFWRNVALDRRTSQCICLRLGLSLCSPSSPLPHAASRSLLTSSFLALLCDCVPHAPLTHLPANPNQTFTLTHLPANPSQTYAYSFACKSKPDIL